MNPSTTRATQLAVQARRQALAQRQRQDVKDKKVLADREAMLAKKKSASELLGVLKHDGGNNNLSLLKTTLKQVEALKKANEKPDMYLTDQ